MKKTLRTLSFIVAFGGISLSAVATGSSSSISELFSLNEASAACCENTTSELNNGRCSFSKNCFPDAGGTNNDCDSTLPNCVEVEVE